MSMYFGDTKLVEAEDGSTNVRVVPNAWEPDLTKSWDKKLKLSAWVYPAAAALGAGVLVLLLLRSPQRAPAVAGHRRRNRRNRRKS